ncbi:hypothetical protein CLV47_103172 [Antricoccus suffuscus]|uniref:Pyridoxamine 5'-phosphate oxidase N-terminal domain-containing protein n=1 Tax=Antricoccus suffuscus TaxID=1629062 RepID=A0A2T1A3D2_9ACTN|nr:PPOX class F420-dependent oxidoreductase [Antricoccus suffuscus]PRZ43115.1 hypothetical protein CLV47_103172 [Antricoccus suffuscus]
MGDLERLGDAKYVSLTTYRKNGEGVPTALWAVREGDQIFVWTVADSWKVKRLRKNPKVEVAACDMRGNVAGAPVSGTAAILDGAQTERVRRLLRAKYGVVGRLTVLGSRLRRGKDGTVGIAITLTAGYTHG